MLLLKIIWLYTCKIFFKTTTDCLQLILSLTNYSKAKPCFICVYCGKNFSQQGNFEEHVKVKHENSATFNCPECPRSFGTSKKLNNHKKLVHMRVKCEVCGQEICNSFMLRRHKASAHGIVPKDVYQCKLCPMFFSLELSLDKHIESKHGIIKPEFRATL